MDRYQVLHLGSNWTLTTGSKVPSGLCIVITLNTHCER